MFSAQRRPAPSGTDLLFIKQHLIAVRSGNKQEGWRAKLEKIKFGVEIPLRIHFLELQVHGGVCVC